jgi:hypothetical protein
MGDAVDGCHNAPASAPDEPPSDDGPPELDPLPLELDPVAPEPLPEPDEPPEPEPAPELDEPDEEPEPDGSTTPPLSSFASAEPEDPHATGEMTASTETSRASRAVSMAQRTARSVFRSSTRSRSAPLRRRHLRRNVAERGHRWAKGGHRGDIYRVVIAKKSHPWRY